MSWFRDDIESWAEAALTPRFLRVSADAPPVPLPALNTSAAVRALTEKQARHLTGAQIDGIIREKLYGALGSRWLMREQECEYRPPSLDRAARARQ